MGRQIQLYLLPTDVAGFEKELRERLKARFVAPLSDEPMAHELQSCLVIEAGVVRIDSLLCRHDLSQVRFEYLPKRKLWAADVLRSDVVEFSGCYYRDHKLKRGRLFYSPGYYDESGSWIKKSDVFLKWAAQITRLAKKAFQYDRTLKALVGPDALAWKVAGGTFEAL